MSHFTVMVIGDNIEKQLEPFVEQVHEPKYAKYRKFKNCTREVKSRWEKETQDEWYPNCGIRCDSPENICLMEGIIKDGEASVTNFPAPMFDWSGLKDGGKVHFTQFHPRDGKKRRNWIKKQVHAVVSNFSVVNNEPRNRTISATFTKIDPPNKIPVNKVYKNIDAFADEYFGYKKIGDKYGYYHNPNAKWDWWSVGGRWTGFFKAKKGVKFPNDLSTGTPGLLTECAGDGWHDSIRKCDIDFEAMKAEAVESAKENWKKYQEELAKNAEMAKFIFQYPDDVKTEEDCIKYKLKTYLSTFALLKDGKWYEKGKMGWWAIVSNENKDWCEEFTKMFEELPEDTLITVVDCHI